MNLSISNFAKISSADVSVSGLSVIAGPNGSGKSTVGKLFFCILTALHKTKTDFTREKIKRIRNVFEHTENFTLDDFFKSPQKTETLEIAQRLLDAGNAAAFAGKYPEHITEKIEKIIGISENDFLNACIEKMFKYEFGYQLLNINNMQPASLRLKTGSDAFVSVDIKTNTDFIIQYKIESAKKPIEAFYIDTPYIMDDVRFGAYHRRELQNRLTRDADGFSQKIFARLFTDAGGGETVNITNISAGFKTILMLKRLYARNYLKDGNLLILDEPEIHLHPNLQVTLAEILVKLTKTGASNVLINTHSPYFIEAIETFAEKHKIENKCRFYLTSDEHISSRIIETTSAIDKIYKLLAEPFERLERIRNEQDDPQ